MTVDHSAKRTGRVTNEGDQLYYEVRGQGTPLILIPGASGDADRYMQIAEILSDEYKVIIYDRRAHARSTMNVPDNFEVSQQARDVVAVLHAAGEEAAYVCGSSGGAVIALEMAKTHPQACRAIIAHEPPLTSVHPDAKKWQKFNQKVYQTAVQFGLRLAMLQFGLGMGIPVGSVIKSAREQRKSSKIRTEPSISPKDSMNFFVIQEMLPISNYPPDIETIKNNHVQVVMAGGKESLDKRRWYAQTAQILAEKLGCEMVIFPGHHFSFADMPNEWAAALRGVLHKVEGKNSQ